MRRTEYLADCDGLIHIVPRTQDDVPAVCGAAGPFFIFFEVGPRVACSECQDLAPGGMSPDEALDAAARRIGRALGEPGLSQADVRSRLAAGRYFEGGS